MKYVLNLDKPRRLKFGFKAIRLIREQFGDKDISELINMKLDELPKVVWAGLVWEDESLTVEKVEELIDEKVPDEYRVIDIVEVVMKAMTDQIGVGPVKKKKTTSKKQEKRLSQ